MSSVRLGTSQVRVTPIGLGTAAIGNLYQEITDTTATATVHAAWRAGIRYFDTAPHYGLGLAERRLNAALRGHARDEYVLSTKVGRVLVPNANDVCRSDNEGFAVTSPVHRTWDFSRDGVRRTLDDSRTRLGIDRIDIVLIHDPDESSDPAAAAREAYPVLHEMRSTGEIGAIGVGSKDCQMLQAFVADTDVDVILLAGRYTLLEQPAAASLLPECLARDVAVLNAGVFNSGLLATHEPGEHYEYAPAPSAIRARANQIAAVCNEHGASLPQAALWFARAHPAIACTVLGAGAPEQLRKSVSALSAPPPAELWADLTARGLLTADLPVPESAQ